MPKTGRSDVITAGEGYFAEVVSKNMEAMG